MNDVSLSLKDFKDWRVLLATTGGLGLVPVAPGTVTSLVAVLIWWGLIAELAWVYQAIAVLAIVGIGYWAIAQTLSRHNVGDDQRITIDEAAGQWVTLFCLPDSILYYVLAFVFFRIVDIAKPFPISWLEKNLEGARGILYDDLVAAVLAAMLVYLLVVALVAFDAML